MTQSTDSWLVDGGEMGRMIRAKDWSQTPLGSIDQWSQSLRTTVGLCLASNFPINLIWGAHHTQIFNDGYLPLCGDKYKQVLGANFRESWASAWSVLSIVFERALRGETSFLENQRMFLDRNGYLEESFFTFSLSPIRDESGQVAGLFHPATETTSRMLGERRTKTLRDLANNLAGIQSSHAVYREGLQTLVPCAHDINFALIYEWDQDGTVARLVGQAGLDDDTGLRPVQLNLQDTISPWPLHRLVADARAFTLDGLDLLGCGPYPEGPHRAMLLPLLRPGLETAIGVLIIGVSPRLPFDAMYQDFLVLVANTLSSALTNARAYEEEKRKADELAALDKAKTTFFSNISHEFRTPLTLMLVPLEELLQHPDGDLNSGSTRERLELMHRNSLRLLKLVNNLLDFSRIEAGRMEGTFRPLPLDDSIREICSYFESAAAMSGIEIITDMPGPFEPVYVDHEMWEMIILNLLSNALKYTLKGFVRISMRQTQGLTEITVQDTGIGIPKQHLPRLFDRFYRVHDSQGRSYEGTGIGLAMVKELLKLHGGDIFVSSEAGLGSTFRLTLPLGIGHLPQDRLLNTASADLEPGASELFTTEARAMTEFKAPAPTVTASPSEQPRILLIDDNRDMRETMRKILFSSYEVITAADGWDGFELAREHQPDLILCDIMMPRLNGLELISRIRDDEKLRTTPCILISARAGQEAKVQGLDQGADDYLVKPFSSQELLARVAAHLKMARARDEAARRERELTAAFEAARRSNQLKDEFLATISHELRTPMNAILGFSEILRDEEPGSEFFNEALAAILRNAEQQNRIITDLLDISRLSTGKVKFATEVVALDQVIRAAIEALGLSARTRNIRIQWTAPVEPIQLRGDAGRLQQVLWNLLSNALRFSRDEASVEVHQALMGGEVQISIVDHGEGMAAEFLPFAFDALRQEDGSVTRAHGGLGLGLKIVREIIENHGGQVTIDSAGKGQGTTVTVTLPLLKRERENILLQPDSHRSRFGPRVL